MKTTEYIDALKPLAKSPTIYAVAQLLEMNEDTVRHYAKGRRHFDSYAAFRVAELLDLPPAQVLADAEAERETDEKRRVYWESMARKLAGSTVAALLTTSVICGSFLVAQPASASTTEGNAESSTLYIMSNKRRRLSGLLERLRCVLGQIETYPTRLRFLC